MVKHVQSPLFLFVTGMHRSGTSVAARLANLLGLGISENLISADSNNERGYWEHRNLVELNDQILTVLGSPWYDPKYFSSETLSSLANGSFGDEASDILKHELALGDHRVLKDPRLCRLLPFWFNIAERMGTEAALLISYRHPEEVASSLAERDNFPRELSIYLWLIYNLNVEYYSRGKKRAFICYENVVSDWKTTMSDAGISLNMDWQTLPQSTVVKIDSYLSRDLQHHKTSDHYTKTELEELAEQVYELLAFTEDLPHLFDEIRLKVDRLTQSFSPIINWLSTKKHQLDIEVDVLRESASESHIRGELIAFLRQLLLYSKTRKLAIWGGGSSGKRIFTMLKEVGFIPELFIDSDSSKWGKSIFNCPIISPDTIFSEQPNKRPYVIIGSMFSDEISQQLVNNGCEQEVDFSISPLFYGGKKYIHRLLGIDRNPDLSSHQSCLNIVPYYIDPKFNQYKFSVNTNKSIAIHLHLYEKEKLMNLVSRLQALDAPFSLFVSVSCSDCLIDIQTKIKSYLPQLIHVSVVYSPAWAKDLIPMIVQFGQQLLQYDVIGHFHTGDNDSFQNKYYDKIFDVVLGEPNNSGGRISHIHDLLNQSVKLVYPEKIQKISQVFFSEKIDEKFIRKYIKDTTSISIDETLPIEYPDVTFFWSRSDCLQDYLSQKKSYDEIINDIELSVDDFIQLLKSTILVYSSQYKGDCYRLQENDSINDYRYFEEQHDFSNYPLKNSSKILSYYLPQFQVIPENDAWHGKGFTEWTKVSAANPLFEGHYQQHIPHHDIGYYSLDTAETIKKQADLMQKSRVYGQVFYHYWFSGKLILEKPAQILLENSDINMPFCFCWANENWTRQWDGNENDILLRQEYSLNDAREFIQYLIPFFKDERYIKINSCPMLFIYRPSLIPDAKKYLEIWAEECSAAGVAVPYVVAVLTRGTVNPHEFGMDAGVERVLYDWTADNVPDMSDSLSVYETFSGSILDYDEVVRFYSNQTQRKSFTYFRSLVPMWDNTARYASDAFLLHGSTPQRFQQWLENSIDFMNQTALAEHQFVLINAWNEWAEGAHLEPDTRFGYSYLNSVGRALSGISYKHELLCKQKYQASLKLHVLFSKSILKQFQLAPELKKRFMEQLITSLQCNALSISSNKDELFASSSIHSIQEEENADYVLEFRQICFFDVSLIPLMLEKLYSYSDSALIPNVYNSSDDLIDITDNGSVTASSAVNAPFILYQKKSNYVGVKNIRMIYSAHCFISNMGYELPNNQSTVTTILRFHKSADILQLKNALYCLAMMEGCDVIPLICAQDLSKSQKIELDDLLRTIPFPSGIEPIVHYYSSSDGNKDLRSKMLNKSLQQVQSQYAAFLDFDDLLMPHAYRWLINRLQITGKAVSFGRVYETIFDGDRGLLIQRNRTFEYGYSYDNFIQQNHAPLHSFMLDLSQLNLTNIEYIEEQMYMEDYYLTLQLFNRKNVDWSSLLENMYIGDYIYSLDREHTLANADKVNRKKIYKDEKYIYCEKMINELRKKILG